MSGQNWPPVSPGCTGETGALCLVASDDGRVWAVIHAQTYTRTMELTGGGVGRVRWNNEEGKSE